MATAKNTYQWKTDPYLWQRRKFWPKDGKHILAQFDDETVVVYQAFKPAIAEYAVRNQRFGGEQFSFGRMSWIKTNFLWMMYRCGWAEKQNQERVLAIRITRDGFHQILANACTISLQKSKKISQNDLCVRLQWDPDHSPNGGKMTRRAIQLGLKGEVLRRYSTEWVVQIDDITQHVKRQYLVLQKAGEDDLETASERVYPVPDPNTASRIELDFYEEHHKNAVVVKFPVSKETRERDTSTTDSNQVTVEPDVNMTQAHQVTGEYDAEPEKEQVEDIGDKVDSAMGAVSKDTEYNESKEQSNEEPT